MATRECACQVLTKTQLLKTRKVEEERVRWAPELCGPTNDCAVGGGLFNQPTNNFLVCQLSFNVYTQHQDSGLLFSVPFHNYVG